MKRNFNWIVPLLIVVLVVASYLVLGVSESLLQRVHVILNRTSLRYDDSWLIYGLPVVITALSTLYYFIDYRQHYRPLAKEMPGVKYGPAHHAKVVVMPRIKYRWKALAFWFGAGTIGLVALSMSVAVQVNRVYAYAPDEFVTTWKTDNLGASNDDQITIPTTGGGYNYNVDWGDGNTSTGQTGDSTHTYASAGTYTVKITGDFPRIFFDGYATSAYRTDEQKILSVEQWGTQQWTSMAKAFRGCNFLVINAIDSPDLSSATDMSEMFFNAYAVNQNISNWNTSSVTDMGSMFSGAGSFNQPLDAWNVSNVTNMIAMFNHADSFNQPLNSWDTSSVADMSFMFASNSSFDQDISGWNTGNVISMEGMFQIATAFNQNISGWDTSSVTDMSAMLFDADSFNQPLNSWDTSSVTDMRFLFANTQIFNQPLGSWDTSSVTDMSVMFAETADFNQDISDWNTSMVTDMGSMFSGAKSFNQPIDSWNTSNATNMNSMFYQALAFNRPLSTWDTSNVTDMLNMFGRATAFNQPIGSWNTSSVTRTAGMFSLATSFNQDISSWNVASMQDMEQMFLQTPMSYKNYDLLLESWSTQPLQNGVKLSNGPGYCTAGAARANIISNYGWTIWDAGQQCPGLSVDQYVYSFIESSSDDGSIANTIDIIADSREVFANTSFTEGVHFTATNIPQGLSLAISNVGNDGDRLQISLNGNADSHADADDVSGIDITFLDPAFSDLPASMIRNNPLTGFSVNFSEEYIPPNNAPYDIYLNNVWVDENQSPPTTVGSLSTDDPDSGNTHSYSINCDSAGADDASFSIGSSNQLILNISADYEQKNSYSVCIRTTDQGGLYYDKNFDIYINDIYEEIIYPQTDFSLSVAPLWAGDVKSGDSVGFRYSLKNEGPNQAILSGVIYTITPKEFDINIQSLAISAGTLKYEGTFTINQQSGMPQVLIDKYEGQNFSSFEFTGNSQDINIGDSLNLHIGGVANADFINNKTTTKAVHINENYESSFTQEFYSALQNNEDIFDLPSNNVATYTYQSQDTPTNPGGGNGTITTPTPDKSTSETTTIDESTQNPYEVPNNYRPAEVVENDTTPNFQDLVIDRRESKSADKAKARQALSSKSGKYILSGTVAEVAQNLPWILLQILIVIMLVQSARQYLQNRTLKKAIAISKKTRDSLDGFMGIVSHYLRTAATVIGSTAELIPATEETVQNPKLSMARNNLTSVPLGLNKLVSSLKNRIEPIDNSNQQVIDSTSNRSFGLWVIGPIVLATAFYLVNYFGLNRLGVWDDEQMRFVFGATILVASSIVLFLSYVLWKKQKHANKSLALANDNSNKSLQAKLNFIEENSLTLTSYDSRLSESLNDVTDSTLHKFYESGLTKLRKISTSFAKVFALNSITNNGYGTLRRADLENSIARFSQVAQKRGISLDVNTTDALAINMAPDELDHVVATTIANAIKFTKDSKPIKISAKNTGNIFEFTVQDNGVGIPKDKLDTLMQPFSRATSTTTYDYEGLGLNLYITRLIANKYGGDVKIKSQGGEGTTVMFKSLVKNK